MKRCVVVGGADIAGYSRIRAALREDDFCIFCDSAKDITVFKGKNICAHCLKELGEI